MIEDEITRRVLRGVADAAERVGGKFMEDLGDGRYITVIVLHEDAEPVPGGTS